MTKMDSHDVVEILAVFYRQIGISPGASVIELRTAAERLTHPACSLPGFRLDAELAWIVWLEEQAADSDEDAERLDRLLLELVPDLDAWRRYLESFPPGPAGAAFRRLRGSVGSALCRRPWSERATPQFRYAAAARTEDLTAGASGEDYKTSIRAIDDDGYLRCFVDVQSQRDIAAAEFRVEVRFKGGERMSFSFRIPEHSHFGVNVGPLRRLRIEDIAGYDITRLAEK